MSLAVVHTRARLGIEAPEVQVEIHLSNGLPALNIVGLSETAVRESKDRVRSALLNAGFEFPARRITVNLAPTNCAWLRGKGRFFRILYTRLLLTPQNRRNPCFAK